MSFVNFVNKILEFVKRQKKINLAAEKFVPPKQQKFPVIYFKNFTEKNFAELAAAEITNLQAAAAILAPLTISQILLPCDKPSPTLCSTNSPTPISLFLE